MAPLGDCSFRHEADHRDMTVDLEPAPASGEEELVLEWRFEELYRAGFPDHLALELATTKEVDLHLAVELVGRGCPHPTAARILL